MDEKAELSPLAKALVEIYGQKKQIPPGTERIRVSRTVSAAAFLLEKIRNAVEFRDEHLVRRAAIERIIRRRLILNPEGEGIASYLVKELIWAKYLPSGEIPETTVYKIQQTLDKYLTLRQHLLSQVKQQDQSFYANWFLEVAAAEVEENLNITSERDSLINFMYHHLKDTVTVDGKENQQRNLQVYIAIARTLIKADRPLLRYLLLKIYVEGIETKGKEIVPSLLTTISGTMRTIEKDLDSPVGHKLFLFTRRYVPPFLILKDLFEFKRDSLQKILSSSESLKQAVWEICSIRYNETGQRLRRLAIRAIVYIFITKMLFALLIEVPVDRYLEGKVDLLPLTINITFPPLLMFAISIAVSPPGENNTARIFARIQELLYQQPTKNIKKNNFSLQPVSLKPLLTFIFTILYGLAFILSFGFIIFILSLLGFSLVSQLLFLFFLTVITFFGYRIRQTAREYLYHEREGILAPVFDFFLLPILQVGRWLSAEIAKLNIFAYIFDFFLEIPFKAMFEILEEWFSFIRQKKDEIA